MVKDRGKKRRNSKEIGALKRAAEIETVHESENLILHQFKHLQQVI
jgi:hypothetical protein